MILLPKPPKDWVLRDVPVGQVHDEAFSPSCEPRVTQPTIGTYLVACEYGPYENPSPSDQKSIEELHPRVLDKWVTYDKAMYVDKPGKNDYFLHELFAKYTHSNIELDEKWQMRNKLFPRSYKYEMHCLRHAEWKRLQLKNRVEKDIDNEKLQVLKNRRMVKAKREAFLATKPDDCLPAPFWWRRERKPEDDLEPDLQEDKIKDVFASEQEEEDFIIKSLEPPPVKRWHELPKLFAEYNANACCRRFEMSRVGQPFHSEACGWYYENYPPPRATYIRKPLGS